MGPHRRNLYTHLMAHPSWGCPGRRVGPVGEGPGPRTGRLLRLSFRASRNLSPYPKCEEVDDDDDDYPGGKDLPPAAIAGNSVDGTQRATENSSRKRVPRPAPREEPEAGGGGNTARGNPFNGNRTAVRRTDREEYGADTDHSSDVSDETDESVEERKRRSRLYHVKPDAQFRREEIFPARDRAQEPYDDLPRYLPSVPHRY
ncbi:hypothetical protein SAMD00023353_1300010 [Rosellinia necatrix]|uniref:Uncharacterized protein n=1 Tax=Rosellinia necatrix TaxID=77044 RepID=A0A1S8A781_ROSNE|nr:hypothetical protein SAMD00023353_1300010 [Rosellinia necatrix]